MERLELEQLRFFFSDENYKSLEAVEKKVEGSYG